MAVRLIARRCLFEKRPKLRAIARFLQMIIKPGEPCLAHFIRITVGGQRDGQHIDSAPPRLTDQGIPRSVRKRDIANDRAEPMSL